MRKGFITMCGLLIAVLFGHVNAQSTLNVATGSPTGTYSAMFKDMGKVCVNNSFLKERGTGGSLDNIELLLDNSVSLAFLQLDVLKAKQQLEGDDRVNEIKALLPLYKEEVHVIAKAGPHKNGVFSKATTYTSITDLAGKTVAAWGGSVITSKVISSFLGLKLDVKVYPSQAAALSALSGDQVDAIIAVVGQPASWVKGLNNNYKLLTIPFTDKLGSLYSQAKVSYSNLALGSTQTLAVQSILATRDFKTPSKKTALSAYAKCVRSHLTELQETEGFHPKWNSTTFDNFTAWPEYK